MRKQQIEESHIKSKLDQFELGFEYNKTIQEIKRDVRLRTS